MMNRRRSSKLAPLVVVTKPKMVDVVKYHLPSRKIQRRMELREKAIKEIHDRVDVDMEIFEQLCRKTT